MENITGWFTTENGQHVPIRGNQTKSQAIAEFVEKHGQTISPRKKAVIDKFKEQINVDIEPYLESSVANKRSYLGFHLDKMPTSEQMAIKSYASKHGIQIHDNGGLGHAIWL